MVPPLLAPHTPPKPRHKCRGAPRCPWAGAPPTSRVTYLAQQLQLLQVVLSQLIVGQLPLKAWPSAGVPFVYSEHLHRTSAVGRLVPRAPFTGGGGVHPPPQWCGVTNWRQRRQGKYLIGRRAWKKIWFNLLKRAAGGGWVGPGVPVVPSC